MVKYKQRCIICKQKWAIASFRQQPICQDCEKKLLDKPIENPEMKKLFNINPKFYQENYFLKSVR